MLNFDCVSFDECWMQNWGSVVQMAWPIKQRKKRKKRLQRKKKRSLGRRICSVVRVLGHWYPLFNFYNGKLFGIRAKEHRGLRYNNFRVQSNVVIFDETVSKTYHKGLKDLKRAPRVVKHMCHNDLNVHHFPCLINCYATYLKHIKCLVEHI